MVHSCTHSFEVLAEGGLRQHPLVLGEAIDKARFADRLIAEHHNLERDRIPRIRRYHFVFTN